MTSSICGRLRRQTLLIDGEFVILEGSIPNLWVRIRPTHYRFRDKQLQYLDNAELIRPRIVIGSLLNSRLSMYCSSFVSTTWNSKSLKLVHVSILLLHVGGSIRFPCHYCGFGAGFKRMRTGWLTFWWTKMHFRGYISRWLVPASNCVLKSGSVGDLVYLMAI